MQSKKKSILIIEDEVDALRALGDKFTREGFEVIKAENGKEGVKIALNKQPDFILLDIIMPVMDGLTALKEIKKNKKCSGIPVIVLTNLTDSEKTESLKKLGVEDCLIKAELKLEEVVKNVKKKLK